MRQGDHHRPGPVLPALRGRRRRQLRRLPQPRRRRAAACASSRTRGRSRGAGVSYEQYPAEVEMSRLPDAVAADLRAAHRHRRARQPVAVRPRTSRSSTPTGRRPATRSTGSTSSAPTTPRRRCAPRPTARPGQPRGQAFTQVPSVRQVQNLVDELIERQDAPRTTRCGRSTTSSPRPTASATACSTEGGTSGEDIVNFLDQQAGLLRAVRGGDGLDGPGGRHPGPGGVRLHQRHHPRRRHDDADQPQPARLDRGLLRPGTAGCRSTRRRAPACPARCGPTTRPTPTSRGSRRRRPPRRRRARGAGRPRTTCPAGRTRAATRRCREGPAPDARRSGRSTRRASSCWRCCCSACRRSAGPRCAAGAGQRRWPRPRPTSTPGAATVLPTSEEARRSRAHAHAAWDELMDTLVDFRVPIDRTETPRATAERLAVAELRGDSAGAVDGVRLLGRAEERARYARSPLTGPGLSEAVRAVRRGLASRATRRTRLVAALFPPSVLARWRGAVVDGSTAVVTRCPGCATGRPAQPAPAAHQPGPLTGFRHGRATVFPAGARPSRRQRGPGADQRGRRARRRGASSVLPLRRPGTPPGSEQRARFDDPAAVRGVEGLCGGVLLLHPEIQSAGGAPFGGCAGGSARSALSRGRRGAGCCATCRLSTSEPQRGVVVED